MRIPTKTTGPLSVRAISGTKVVLMAFDISEDKRSGLHGFAVKRGKKGDSQPPQWLKGLKLLNTAKTATAKKVIVTANSGVGGTVQVTFQIVP
jgi:hypothetical protein